MWLGGAVTNARGPAIRSIAGPLTFRHGRVPATASDRPFHFTHEVSGYAENELPQPQPPVVDAGSKTLTSDSHDDGDHGTGIFIGLPGARLHDINEEHGYVDVASLGDRPQVGDRLRIIPNHACGCVNLHDGLLAVRDGVVEAVLPVAGRGLIR